MQNYLKITDRKQLYGLLAVGSISFCFFSLLFILNIYTDIQGHIEQVQAMEKGALLRGNFLYYLIIWLLALGQSKSVFLACSSIVVLTAAVTAKYQITFHYLKDHRLALWLSLALVFAFSLPGPDYYYRGQIPPNIWHNSTTLFLMPFALLLFVECEKYVQDGTRSSLATWLILIALNVFIKPSFFFCLGIVLPLMAVSLFGIKKAVNDLAVPIGVGWLMVAGQYVLTYYFDPSTTDTVVGGGLQIAPLFVWRANSSLIGLSLLASLAFPASVLLLRRLRKGADTIDGHAMVKTYRRSSIFAWALLAFGLLIYIFVAETGERSLHGNFAWQNIVCMYVLFLVSTKWAFGMQRHSRRMRIPAIILSLHVISGIVYLIKIILTGSYF